MNEQRTERQKARAGYVPREAKEFWRKRYIQARKIIEEEEAPHALERLNPSEEAQPHPNSGLDA